MKFFALFFAKISSHQLLITNHPVNFGCGSAALWSLRPLPSKSDLRVLLWFAATGFSTLKGGQFILKPELQKGSRMPEIKRYKQYEILQRPDGTHWELGSGAMGTTYKAFDTNLERAVALKIINDAYLGKDVARQQFLREARSAAGLRHPNIASVYDLGTDRDQYFYVMELIDGITVKEKVRRDGPFGARAALDLILQIASALAAAERQRLVHRDLKPANLMLTEENGEQVVKIIDFGLAKKILPSGEASGAFTIAGGFVGTAEFASPEQIREADLDTRSDIYSLGATFFFMLTGRPPFIGATGK
jgi:Protein kinase domain